MAFVNLEIDLWMLSASFHDYRTEKEEWGNYGLVTKLYCNYNLSSGLCDFQRKPLQNR